MNRFRALLLVALLALAFVGVSFTGHPAQASTPPGFGEFVTSFTGSISSGADITSSVSGRSIAIKALTIASDTAGVVVFRDGSQTGDVIGDLYLEANKPFTVPLDVLGPGMASSKGNTIQAKLSSATLTLTARCEVR
jgi:hypothetical protein